ncbi:MAG TPA: Fic family protein [Polyangiaceae bacterium]|nr:Fic family protein [Polyangiaceae bacterium]
MASEENIGRPLGYASLIDFFRLEVPAPHHTSSVGPGARSSQVTATGVHETFPGQFWREPAEVVEQLVFALKYDGVDLLILRAVFERMGTEAIELALRESPTSAYLRRLWCLYEFLLGERLNLPDVDAGPYVALLEPERYVTRPGPKLRRFRVDFNLLGPDPGFCPIVRFTELLREYEAQSQQDLASSAVHAIAPQDLQRAIRYLYVKETRASFEIERATPSDRMERFVEALFSHGARPTGSLWWGEEQLVELAAAIINDPRFAPTQYRTHNVRVSEQRSLSLSERVHYVAPRHEDIRALMAAFVLAWQEHHLAPLHKPAPGAVVGADGRPYAIRTSCGDPFVDFVVAGCLSFGFVYLHPFSDGNGRIHRLIFNRVLSTTGFTPPEVVVPVSAAILHDPAGYDAALETFSKRIMPFIAFEIDDRTGELTVSNETAWLYRYPDLTAHVEALCGWFHTAVTTELVEELNVLRAIDAAKAAMRDVVEMPDSREDLFLKLCVQSWRDGRGFVLSKTKRSLFAELTDDEVARLETAISEAFSLVARP